jgi:alpha-mannosidase
MVGNAHLDPAWMWSWGEGMEAFLATCRAALDRIEETPAFVFTCSSAAHYRWVEQVEPELFERIRAAIARGQWRIVGGWWVQADCNLPSGEGFVRQALLGQRYFLERFGVTARTAYSPDAFGHTIGLPQLLARAGMNRYVFCRPDPTELRLPSPLVRWSSADGSSVLAYRVPYHYNMYETSVPKKVSDLVDAVQHASPLTQGEPLARFGTEWCLFYGVGNHGGGPTREHIRQIESITAGDGAPELVFSAPDDFFDAIVAGSGAGRIPAWSGPLEMDAPGCYSAHSGIKKLNRASEHRLCEAERLSSMASALLGAPYPAADLSRSWERVCFNHFHDILCGVAIREALDDAIAGYGAALDASSTATRYAMQRLARAIDTGRDGQTLIVFNPHAWPIEENVRFELWHDIDKSLWSQPVDLRMTDDDGEELPCQTGFTSGKIGRDRIAVTFPARLPALGWRAYRVFYGEKSAFEPVYPGTAHDSVLENEHLRIEFSRRDGTIASIVDKTSGRAVVVDGASALVIADGTDTWGHGVERFDEIVGRFAAADVRLVETGPAHATVRARSHFASSWLQQDFRLASGSRVVDVDVKIFWAEEHRMLKLAFPTTLGDASAHAERAYATSDEEPDGRERPCGTWCAVSAEGLREPYSVGIVTDAKHGYSCVEGPRGAELRLTVLRSPSYATHVPHPFDRDEDLDFIDQGIQRFSYRIVASAVFDPPLLTRLGAALCAPPTPHLESAHDATEPELPRVYEGIRIEPANVLAPVVKRAEDGRAWIVRIFEAGGVAGDATIAIPMLDARWSVTMGPNEVRTFRIDDGLVAETTLTE